MHVKSLLPQQYFNRVKIPRCVSGNLTIARLVPTKLRQLSQEGMPALLPLNIVLVQSDFSFNGCVLVALLFVSLNEIIQDAIQMKDFE